MRKAYRDVQLFLAKQEINQETIDKNMIKEYKRQIKILKAIKRKSKKDDSLFECHVVKYRKNPEHDSR